MLPVKVVAQKAAKIHSEILVAGFFEDDRPLTGLTAEVDWIHSGIVSRLILRNKIRGLLGEATLLATQRKLHVHKILIMGLGKRAQLTDETLQDIYSRIDDTLLQLHIKDCAVELFGRFDTIGPGVKAVEAVLRKLGTDPNRRLAVTLLVPDEEKAQRVQQQVYQRMGNA